MRGTNPIAARPVVESIQLVPIGDGADVPSHSERRSGETEEWKRGTKYIDMHNVTMMYRD